MAIRIDEGRDKLKRRTERATEKERVAVAGEEFVLEKERLKLSGIGKEVLATRVEWVSLVDDRAGFDILSFQPDGEELHIKVQASIKKQSDDDFGFWLTESDRLQAENDTRWVLYRVWDVDGDPAVEQLGNVVTHRAEKWNMETATWLVRAREEG